MGGEEAEVRREDQEKINKFSRLHARVEVLEEELKVKAVREDFILKSWHDCLQYQHRSLFCLSVVSQGSTVILINYSE